MEDGQVMLYSGIPASAEVVVPVARFPSSQKFVQGTTTTEATMEGASPLSGFPNSSPLDMFSQGAPSLGAGTGGGSLGHNPQMESDFITEFTSENIEEFVEIEPDCTPDINKDLDTQNFEITQTPRRKIKEFKAPYIGMLFDTLEEAKDYYEEFGRHEGFWICTRSSWKSRTRSNEVTSKLFVCAHHGQFTTKVMKEKNLEENNETSRIGWWARHIAPHNAHHRGQWLETGTATDFMRNVRCFYEAV